MVSRRVVFRAALAAAALAVGCLVPAPASAEPRPLRDTESYPVPESYDAPLLVTIEELTPGELPERGPVVVSGTVINRDVETWSGISLYPFINAGPDCTACPPPITSADELADAADTDPAAVVGNRVVEVSDSINALRPGEVRTYSIRVPRRLLPVTAPGVYWFGVHASGASETTERDDFADGRARTFLPFIPRGRQGVRGKVAAAVVVPLRHPISHLGDGRLARPAAWEAAFEVTGDLGGPLAFGGASAGRPVTWLVDPAVPDAARLLRRGNPERDLGPDEPPDGGEEEDAGDGETSQDPTDEASTEPPDSGPVEEPEPPADDATALAAADWLGSLEVQLRGDEVLALPYGDLDMSATPDRMPDLYAMSREREGTVLSSWETPTRATVASPGGYLDPSAIDGIDDDSVLLVTDRMFGPDDYRRGPPGVGEYDEHPIVATSYGAATGGPGPEPRLGAVAFRQRVLAEAAVRLLARGGRQPLVVVVPPGVDGVDGARFWRGLDAAWLDLTTVAEATDRPGTQVDPESLTYPDEQETKELTPGVFTELEELLAAGRTLQNLLGDRGAVASEVRDEALAGASYHFRTDPEAAVDQLARSRRWIDRRLGRVGIDAPLAVTLSSADGSFAVTVSNRLDRTVVVRIAADSPEGVEVDVGDPVVLAAESRTTVLLDAHSSGAGVHNVTLSVTDVDGTPLGSEVEVPIRSGQVSEVIWLILGTGAGILLLAIVVRLVRRIRNRGTEAAA